MPSIAVPEATTAPTFKSAHFIGVGGAGMSGIALVLHERGCRVTGSDLKTSRYIRQLTRAGVPIHVGHTASTIDEFQPDVVVVSTAIPETNPELVRARELGIPVWHRAKMLSALGYGRTTVACAGTHGKTTTSSMVATMLDRMELDPSFLIGGVVEGYGTNGKNGDGEYFVVEADHMDHYDSLEQIEETFCTFMGLVGEDGTVIVCGEDPRLVELARSCGRTVFTYGEGDGMDVCLNPAATRHAFGSDFTVTLPDGSKREVSIKNNPGRHNMLNATAALTAAYVLGLDTERAAEALSTFEGARRRFTQVGEVRGVTSKMLADKIRAAHPGKSVYYVSDHAALMARIDDVAQAGDLLITMGAGDITTVGPEYLEHVANEAE